MKQIRFIVQFSHSWRSIQSNACNKLADALEKAMDSNGTEYQADGNMLDYYFSDEGGISLRTVESYTTEDDARAAMSKWHTEYSI